MTTPQAAVQGEKRWVATMMVDLAGSTELTEALGPERAFALVQEVLGIAVGEIEAAGGHFVDHAGDSVFAMFGAPVAVEHAALAACRAALALRAAVAVRAADLAARHGATPALRIGIAGGRVLVATPTLAAGARVNALGTAVNLAARLQALGGPGDILCAEAIRGEVEGYAILADHGRHEVKGLGAQQVYRLIAVPEGVTHLAARMARGAVDHVGRAGLVADLRGWLAGAAGVAPALAVTGPPGIGKSRLIAHALTAPLAGVGPVLAACEPGDLHAPLRGATALLSAAARTDGVAAQDAGALARWLAALVPVAGEGAVQALAATLAGAAGRAAGLVPQGAGQAHQGASAARDIRLLIVAALAALMARPDRRLILEDAHWLDPLSRAALAEAADRGGRILLTMRGGDAGPAFRTLPVPPLTPAELRALCALPRGGGGGDPDPAMIARVIEKSEGNPLFAEEILRAHDIAGDPAPAAETATIQGLVFFRFDALGPAEKAVLRQAAVIGRDFANAHVDAAAGSPEAAAAALAAARLAGLVEPGPAPGHWRFAHVLFQDSILSSIPDTAAPALHRRAAEALEGPDATPGPDLARRVASHWERAGLPGRAVRHHLTAALADWRVYAMDACIDHLSRAEAHLDAPEVMADPALGAAVVVGLCRACDVVGEWSRLAEVADRRMALLATMTDPRPRIEVSTLRAKTANQAGDFVRAESMIAAALDDAQALGEPGLVAFVQTALMDIANDRMDITPAQMETLIAATRDYAASGSDPQMQQIRLYEIASWYRQSGDVPRALAVAQDLIDLGARTNDSRATAFGWWVRASVTAMVEDYAATLHAARESMRLSLPGTMDHSTARVFETGARIMTGDRSVAALDLVALGEARLAAGDRTVAIIALFYAAVVSFLSGRIREGQRLLARTDALIRGGAERGLVQHYLIKKAEFFLTVAGLYPSPIAPALPRAGDLPAAIAMRLRARATAVACLDELAARLTVMPGFHAARVAMARGRLARAGRRADQARALFDAAEAEFARQDLPAFVAMVRALRG